MNWEAMSAIGEWVGTIIVVVTLVYLARQVHLNTVTNRVAGITGIAIESFYVQYEQDIMDEATMKAYARLSVDLISNNKVVKEHWKDSRDYSPGFKSWMDGQVAQLD